MNFHDIWTLQNLGGKNTTWNTTQRPQKFKRSKGAELFIKKHQREISLALQGHCMFMIVYIYIYYIILYYIILYYIILYYIILYYITLHYIILYYIILYYIILYYIYIYVYCLQYVDMFSCAGWSWSPSRKTKTFRLRRDLWCRISAGKQVETTQATCEPIRSTANTRHCLAGVARANVAVWNIKYNLSHLVYRFASIKGCYSVLNVIQSAQSCPVQCTYQHLLAMNGHEGLNFIAKGLSAQ